MRNPICTECLSRICVHVMPQPPHLTPREVNILRLLSGGLSNKEIGALLGTTEGTVKIFMCQLYRKLGMTSRLEAALWVLAHMDVLNEGREL